MPAVEITLTTAQLVSAYTQLGKRERRNFLMAIFDQPSDSKFALEVLAEARQALQRKFPPAKQRQLDTLLNANSERKLNANEQRQLNLLIEEYGEGLIEKARAQYVVETSHRAGQSAQ